MNPKNFAISLLLVIAAVASVIAQTPAPSTEPAAATATEPESEVQQRLEDILEEQTTTDTYRYDPQGRRDPFRSLIGPAPQRDAGQRPEGVPGYLIDEIKLQGIFGTRQGPAAMITGPDNKGHLIHVGDKVYDGEVIRITSSGIVFRQEVNDPTRIERYREVVKDLEPAGNRQ